jgi:hypothetical protein
MASRLDRVRINLPYEQVDISQQERDVLLEELCFVADCKPIRERFVAVGAISPVELTSEQCERLREALTVWQSDVALPDGIERLRAALARAA